MTKYRKQKIMEKVFTITYLVIAVLAGYQFACATATLNKWRATKCIGNEVVCEQLKVSGKLNIKGKREWN